MALTQVPNSMLSTGAPSWDAYGNVGIGTTSPSANLQVAAANPRVRVTNTSGTQTDLMLGADSGVVWLGNEDNGPLYFITNNAERMRIDASGIVTGTAGNLMLVQNTSRITLSGTATVISTAIPSWAKRITLNIVGMSTSGTSHYIVQIGSGSYTSTGYLGSGSVLATSGATSAFTTGFGMVNNNGATTVSHLTMTLNLQNAATNTWSESHAGAYSSLPVSMVGGGSVSLGGVLDQLRITTVNGTDTFTAGTINFQYE